MVQGLAFLTKKSWHTKNLANQEKVWIAEQREKAEVAKTAELAKQIQQEREEEELQNIAGTSDPDKKLDRGIAWLYDGHRKDSETAKADAEKQAEDYLLGKAYEPQQKMLGDLESAVDDHEGVNAVVASVDATLPAEDSVANRNEAFRVRHEDPMYEVARQKVRQEKALEHRKELYVKAGYAVKTKHEDSDGDDAVEHEKKQRKKEKKRKSEKKKRKKKRHRYSSDSAEEDVSREHHRKRSRRSYSRSPSEDSHDKRRSSKSFRRRSRSPRRRRSRSRSPPRYRSDLRHDPRDYERSRRSPRHERDRDHERSRRRGYGADDVFDDSVYSHHNEDVRDEFGRVKLHHTGSNSDHKGSKSEAEKPYGLQGGHGRPKSTSDLGPDRDLLERKRHERDAERQRHVTSKHRRHISKAERQAAVRAMERDAATRASVRDTSRGDYAEDDNNHKPEASFLKRVTAQAHGIEGDQQSLSDRLRQNRHRNQRDTDEFL